MFPRRRKEAIRPGDQNQPPTLSSQDDGLMDIYPKSIYPGQEERLPMLMKGTIFRTSTGEYTDICEMHDLSSLKDYSRNMNSCSCGTCSPANVRRIHIPTPRMDGSSTMPSTFKTFNSTATIGANKDNNAKKIYDTTRSLKTVKLLDRNSAAGLNPPAGPQYYFQLDPNSVHQMGEGIGPDILPGTKHEDVQYIAARTPKRPEKSS